MHIIKRLLALSLSLLILMMNAALAEVPFLVHSNGWDLENIPVEVLLKADVDTHMPFDDDRLAMLTPMTDQLALRLVTGQDEGEVAISLAEEELLSLKYRGNEMQLSCLPGITYTAEEEPLSVLLGESVESAGLYEAFHLSPKGESLLTDGRALLQAFPTAFEEQLRKSENTTTISGYGKSAYRLDFAFTDKMLDAFKDGLAAHCPDGWLRTIIEMLKFSGKQTVRMYFTADNVLLRMEYNGICGPEGDLRQTNLIYKQQRDDKTEKDYVELTTPARKGKNKNNLTFERTLATAKDGSRTLEGSFKYTATRDSVTSIWNGKFELANVFTDTSDVVSGEFSIETKLNGAEKYDAVILNPELTIAGSQDMPVITGCVTVTEKYAGKVTELAKISIDLKRTEPLAWQENDLAFDLSAMEPNDLAAARDGVSQAVATAIVRPIIIRMGADAVYFFRDLPAEAIQSIIDAAASAASKSEEAE